MFLTLGKRGEKKARVEGVGGVRKRTGGAEREGKNSSVLGGVLTGNGTETDHCPRDTRVDREVP